jgi:hypothetical protein
VLSTSEQSFTSGPAPSDRQKNGGYSKEAYWLGCPAEERYNHGSKARQSVIDRGRRLASITIPSVVPPDGYQAGDIIGESNQSIGALAVNTLASKLQFMAFPPDRPILKFELVEHRLRKELDSQPRLHTEINIGLGRLEQEHRRRLEATQMRTAYLGSAKAMLIIGNICWDHLYDVNRPVFHLPTNYIVKRNAIGEQLLVIVKQTTYVMELDEDIQEQIMRQSPDLEKVKDYERVVDIYRVCRRAGANEPYWEYWEEYQGELIKGTEFEADYDIPPLYAAWMIPVYGQDWGRSYCEEYEGDLLICEGHSASLNDGSALASLAWIFAAPGSRTTPRQLKKAGNLTVHTGVATDITIGPDMSSKARDFQFVDGNLEKAARRLARSFLMVSSIQRDAERVTAEEFTRMAAELDQATGGLYSELAQSYQRHVVRRFVALHNDEDKQLPKLPRGVIRVAVITGIEAMGRTVEGQNLTRATATSMEISKGQVARYIDWHDFIRRMYMHESVPTDGLVRTPEQQEEFEANTKQDVARQTLLEKASGPLVGEVSKAAAPMLAQRAAQQMGGQGQPGQEPPPGEQPPAEDTAAQE